jgi:hypothetical protein
MASPVSRLISTRSAISREVPRVISTLPTATKRFSAPICSRESATMVTSPPGIGTTTGAGGGVCACAEPAPAATSAASRASKTRPRMSGKPITARSKGSSQNGV